MLVTSDWIRTLALPEATAKDVCPGVCPGVAIEVIPGATSLPHSYLVTLDSRPAKVFFALAKKFFIISFDWALAAFSSLIQNSQSLAGTMISAFGNANLPSAA